MRHRSASSSVTSLCSNCGCCCLQPRYLAYAFTAAITYVYCLGAYSKQCKLMTKACGLHGTGYALKLCVPVAPACILF